MKPLSLLLLLCLFATSAVIAGCGAGPQPVDEAGIKADNDKAVKARAMFDAAGGDYAKVSESDKAELAKLYGSTANADKIWALMKNPPQSGVAAPPAGR